MSKYETRIKCPHCKEFNLFRVGHQQDLPKHRLQNIVCQGCKRVCSYYEDLDAPILQAGSIYTFEMLGKEKEDNFPRREQLHHAKV